MRKRILGFEFFHSSPIPDRECGECQWCDRLLPCLWLDGKVGIDSYRPDRLGVILRLEQHPKYWEFLSVQELHPNAANSQVVRYLIGKMTDKILVCIVLFGPGDRRRWIVPDKESLNFLSVLQVGLRP